MSELTQVVAPLAARLVALAREYAITVAVAVVVFLVAYDNGGFGESTRDTLAIVLWWVLILCLGLGVWPLARVTRSAWVTGGLLAVFGLWTLLSVIWAADAAGAYAEFTRVMLYVAVFAVAVAGSRRDNAGRWCDGLALGIVAVAVIALVSRLFPSSFSNAEIIRFLPSGQTRLSFPVGYWNGLAILVAFGLPLLLRAALSGRNAYVRALSLAPVPALAGVIYLTSSRTGVVSAVLSVLGFILFAPRRWGALGAAAIAAAGSAAVVGCLAARGTLVDGPLGSARAASQGHGAALIIAGVCVVTALLYAFGSRALARFRPHRALGWALLVIALALVVAGLVAGQPQRRFEEFKRPPPPTLSYESVQKHLFSGQGDGRWQLWASAIDEFKTAPVQGRGAGSFQEWWLQHGSIPAFVQDAHSLYAETLGELGMVGLLLLVASFGAGVVVALRRLFSAKDAGQMNLAAVTAAFLSFAVSASVDWMWELTIVTAVAVACLGLMVGPAASLAPKARVAAAEHVTPTVSRYGVGVAVVLGGWLLICAIAVPLFAGARLRDSQNAVAGGNLRAALSYALDARSIQPWSVDPYLQIALVGEEGGDYGRARKWLARAIARDPRNWQLWYLAGRLDTERGAVNGARHDVERARGLNPHSRLLAPAP